MDSVWEAHLFAGKAWRREFIGQNQGAEDPACNEAMLSDWNYSEYISLNEADMIIDAVVFSGQERRNRRGEPVMAVDMSRIQSSLPVPSRRVTGSLDH